MKRAKATQLASASTPEAPSPARLVEADLASAEVKLSRLLDSSEPIIAEICHYLVDAGGKRLRPTFILLVYRACGGTDAKVELAIDAAIALELIHSATLLHDDIIDSGLLLASAGGFVSLSYEIFFFRTVAYLDGSSATAFALTLAAFLIGLAVALVL